VRNLCNMPRVVLKFFRGPEWAAMIGLCRVSK
jgi:hypothetical protein